jgi:hypothetical protein
LTIIVPLLPFLILMFINKKKRVLRFKHRDCDGKGCDGCQGYGYIELHEESWSVLT